MARPRDHRPTKAGGGSQPSGPPRPARRGGRRWVGALVGLAVVAAIVAIAISGTSSTTTPGATVQRDPVTVAAGADLYAANCAVCHGPDLNGSATGPPFLLPTYAPNHHADEAFQRAVVGGVVPHHWTFGPMPPVSGLTREDVALIVEFVRSEQEANGIFFDPRHG